jgi:hypothetical protein
MNYDWVQPTLERVADILKMPDRNNTFGTPKVDPKLAWEAVNFFWPAVSPYTPAPRVQPNKRGGIEFIWSSREVEVLVAVNPNERPTVNLGGTVANRPGIYATPLQILEAGLRQIDQETDPASLDASQ